MKPFILKYAKILIAAVVLTLIWNLFISKVGENTAIWQIAKLVIASIFMMFAAYIIRRTSL